MKAAQEQWENEDQKKRRVTWVDQGAPKHCQPNDKEMAQRLHACIFKLQCDSKLVVDWIRGKSICNDLDLLARISASQRTLYNMFRKSLTFTAFLVLIGFIMLCEKETLRQMKWLRPR